jgi:ATP-dependent Clp protease ATP-binding subunit ClpC
MKYKLGNWRICQRTLQEMYPSPEKDGGLLAGFRKQTNKPEDRPFSTAARSSLTSAGKLADQMGESVVETHHLFLSLLDYQEAGGNETAFELEEDASTCDNLAWAVLYKMDDCMDDETTALDVCQSLIGNIKSSKELVTGESASSMNTPTLAECGVDLTQMARDGLLDPVHGREKEIRACLRTLLRRRKNNVCLIGDPGVGKVRKNTQYERQGLCYLNE